MTSSIQVSEELLDEFADVMSVVQMDTPGSLYSMLKETFRQTGMTLAMRSKDHSIAVDDVREASQLEAMQAEIDRLRALIRKADEIAGESLSGCHDTAFYGEWCGEVVFSDPSLDRQGK